MIPHVSAWQPSPASTTPTPIRHPASHPAPLGPYQKRDERNHTPLGRLQSPRPHQDTPYPHTHMPHQQRHLGKREVSLRRRTQQSEQHLNLGNDGHDASPNRNTKYQTTSDIVCYHGRHVLAPTQWPLPLGGQEEMTCLSPSHHLPSRRPPALTDVRERLPFPTRRPRHPTYTWHVEPRQGKIGLGMDCDSNRTCV